MSLHAFGAALRQKLDECGCCEISPWVVPVEEQNDILNLALHVDAHVNGRQHRPVTFLSTPLAVVRHIFREDPDVDVYETVHGPMGSRIVVRRKPHEPHELRFVEGDLGGPPEHVIFRVVTCGGANGRHPACASS